MVTTMTILTLLLMAPGAVAGAPYASDLDSRLFTDDREETRSISELADGIPTILDGEAAPLPRRSLMKEILSVTKDPGADAAMVRFQEILETGDTGYTTSPTDLFIAAIELRSDPAAVRASVPACDSSEHASLADRFLDTFDTHRYVFLGSTHGGLKRHEFLLCTLLRPEFPDLVTDIVVEFVSGAHQRLLDRYVVELEDLPADTLRLLALDTDRPELFATIPQVPEFLETVREVNRRRPLSGRIRVLGGSETIDWSAVERPEDLAPFPFKTNWAAHLIAEHLVSDPETRALVVYGDGGHILHGGTVTGDVEATVDPDSLFVFGTIRHLESGDREAVAAFGDPEAPFFIQKEDFPEVRELPDDLGALTPETLTERIDALIYLGPAPDVDMMGTIPLSDGEREELRRRRGIKGSREVMEIRFGGRARWFSRHPLDLPPDPRGR